MLFLGLVRATGHRSALTPPPETYFFDTFTTGANTILSSHTPDTGTAWFEQERTGAAFLRANVTGFCINSGSANSVRSVFTASPTPSNVNYLVQADFHYNAVPTDVDNPFALLARWTDASPNADSSYYGAEVLVSSGSPSGIVVRLFKSVAGTKTSLGTATIEQPANVSFLVRLEVDNSPAQRVYIDGVLRVSASDAALVGGAAGIAIGNVNVATDDTDSNWRIDNYLVQALS